MTLTPIYGGLNAKIKAMKGQLLQYSDYDSLAQKESVEAVGWALKEYKNYESVLEGIESSNIRRGELERRLVFYLHRDFMKIYKFVYDFNLRKFFESYFLSNEIIILKYLMAYAHDNKEMPFSFAELEKLMGRHLKIDIHKMLSSRSVEDFIENLKGSIFYNVLSNGNYKSLFDLEMRLDVYYYMNIWEAQEKYLDKTNMKAMQQINGTEIDLRNILWAYRLKSYYKLNQNEIYAYLIPVNYRLRKERLMRMIEAKDREELWNEIRSSYYAGMFLSDDSMENSYYNAVNKAFLKSYRQYPHSIVPAVSYIYFKEIEIKNIISLLESKRYGLKQEEILNHIILPREKR